MLIIPSVSREYLHVPIGGATSSMGVELAVIPSGQEEPDDADWTDADAWDGSVAKLLIGPGGTLALEDGTYRVWVKVTASPEIPVIRSGLVEIT